MDGYTKAVIKEAMAKRSARQVRFDEIMARVFNGFIVYALGVLFYGFWGWVILSALRLVMIIGGLYMHNIDKLDNLIERLDTTALLDKNRAKSLYHAHLKKATVRMVETGQSFGRASGGLSILNQSEKNFKSEIKRKNDDLESQIDIFNEALDIWFAHGEPHPPYYPWRIAVILSKAKRKDKEEEFLRAYSRHFKKRHGGARDAKINARAAKFGI